MFFVILTNMFRWLALFVAGSSLGCLLFQGASIGETLGTLGFALFVWLLAKGIDFIIRIPLQLKFLDTKTKRIIAAAASFAMGFLFALCALGMN